MSYELVSDGRFSCLLSAVTPERQRESPQELSSLEAKPQHPSLRFKRVHPNEPIYSVRVGIGWRAMGLWEDNDIYWFWIGSHDAYERLIK